MKIYKRALILFFCLTASFYAADWTGSSSVPKNTKNIDGKAFYVITSAEELTWFAEQVNGGASEINAILANDIHFMDDTSEISTLSWTPIGKDSTVMFNGIFDGAGRTIYGLYSKQEKFIGIFGVTDVNATIKNVKSANFSLYWEDGSKLFYIGGIVAFNNGKIDHCVNEADFGYKNSGGIASWNAGTVTNCTNNGAISGGGGGIVDRNVGMISDCVNNGTVSEGGGIVGENRGMVEECTNNGSAFSGIAGVNSGMIMDCKNLGPVSGYGSGGLVVKNSSSAKMFNSFSAAVASGANAGVVYSDSGEVLNCYYDSDVLKGLSTESPNMGLRTSDMQCDRFAWVLNTTNGDSAHSGVWSRDSVGYPIFADSLHKPIYKVAFDDSGATSNRFTNYKGLVSFPENPESPDGKVFFGWYTDDNVKVKETTVFTKDQTVYAFYCEPSSCPPEPSDALVANIPSPAWSVSASGRNFQIHAAPVGKPYALFDLQGKVLANGRIESPEMTLSAPRAGSYIVRIGNHSVRVNAK